MGRHLEGQIIVGTPGKIVDLLKRGQIKPQKVKVLVLDEADNMIDIQGLGDQSVRVRLAMPKGRCQVLLFSATFPEAVEGFARKFASPPTPHEIRLKVEELTLDGIKQFYMDCKNYKHKLEVLMSLYSILTIGQSIIFVRRRETADDVAKQMTAAGHAVVALHGMHESHIRDAVMDGFRKGESKVLITTNVLARGIDVLQVNLVVNYDIPLTGDNQPDCETYLHRIGRTGRFGRQGVSINFVHDDRSMREMKAIEEHFGKNITRVPTDDLEGIEKILRKAGVR
jgi:ATP-dependent RNA helicase DDX19/DBP5